MTDDDLGRFDATSDDITTASEPNEPADARGDAPGYRVGNNGNGMATHRNFFDQVIDLIELIASGRLSPDVINWADLAERGRAHRSASPPLPIVPRSSVNGTLDIKAQNNSADADIVAAWMRRHGFSKYTEACERLNAIIEDETGKPSRYTSPQFSVWAGGKRRIPKRIRHIFASSS